MSKNYILCCILPLLVMAVSATGYERVMEASWDQKVSELDHLRKFENLLFGATHSEVLGSGVVLSEVWTSPDFRMQGFKYEGFMFGGVRDDIPLHAWFFDDMLFAVSIGPVSKAARNDFDAYKKRFVAEIEPRRISGQVSRGFSLHRYATSLFVLVERPRSLVVLSKPAGMAYLEWMKSLGRKTVRDEGYPDLLAISIGEFSFAK